MTPNQVSLASVAPAFADKGNDQQIQKDVEKQLQGKKDFQGVTATTDDQIVTLNGTVMTFDIQVKSATVSNGTALNTAP